MKRLFLLLTVCASALYSSAGYRYVSQTSGDNNNDGLSWATAKKTITAGIGVASSGDSVLVAAGTYNESVSMVDGVAILGGYNAATGERDIDKYESIVDGTGISSNLVVKYSPNPEVRILFEGFTVQNANNAQWGSPTIYLRANITINRCHIRNCKANDTDTGAGAVYIDTKAETNPPAIISNCLIEFCEGSKGATAIYNKGGIIENCIIRGCTGERNVIRNYNAVSTVRNCLIYNNTIIGTGSRGAIENNKGLVVNNTVCNNYAPDYAGIKGDESGKNYNNIFWGNKSADGFGEATNYISSGSASSHNVADQGVAESKFLSVSLATNNFAADGPNFSNPTSFAGAPTSYADTIAMLNADFTLTAASTALLNNGLASQAPETDINGTARPIGEGVDMGCYEYNPGAAAVALTGATILQDTIWVSVGTSGAFAVLFTPSNATNKRTNWTIDDETIATISNGLVSGVKVGTTVARMTSVDGNFTDTAVVVIRPWIFPNEVLAADTLYKMGEYTIPSFIEFLVAKEEARIDSLTCKDLNVISEKLAAMNAMIGKLKTKEEPYNLIANINGDPKTHMAFCWFTNEGIKEGKVQLLPKANATAEDFASINGVITVPATATTTVPLHYTPIQPSESPKYDICTAAGLPRNTYFTYESHKALAENLTPGTTYSWRVGFDGHWSAIGQFKTQAANQGDFSFIYMSDSHIQDAEYIEYANMCAKAAAKNEKDVNFCLFPGDFVDTGDETNSEWQWERWFEGAINPVLMNMAVVPTDGNHDDSPLDNYDYHFNTDWGFYNAAQTKPQFKGITYSFVYGDVLFLVYSLQDWFRSEPGEHPETSMKSDYLKNDVRNWFVQQCAAHPNVKYRVTLSHKNIFSGAGHHLDSETPVLREMMLPILKECEIDLAIQGHDHCYEVIGPINPDTRKVVEGAVADVQTVAVESEKNVTGKSGGTFTTDDGTLYFIGATCGRKRYYPHNRSKLESEYTTNTSILFDDEHHNVEGLFDLFTSMFGQPGAPSYSRFNVTSEGIEVKSYTTDEEGNSTLYNTINVKRTKPHTIPQGFENVSSETNVRNGEKFIRDGRIYIRIDGKTYDVLGQEVK